LRDTLEESTIGRRDVHGDLDGLKSSQKKKLEELYSRHIPATEAITQEFATKLTFLSEDLNRVVGVLVDRKGNVEEVMVGDAQRVYLPDIGRRRAGESRFRGIRLIRTKLTDSDERAELSRDDLTDLSKLQLDMVMGIEVGAGGYPGECVWAHLLPENPDDKLWEMYRADNPEDVDVDFDIFIHEIEDEFQRKADAMFETGGKPAMLVYVSTPDNRDADTEVHELHNLCNTAGVNVVDTIVQRRTDIHPKYAVGKGKIEEITLKALQYDCDLVIFGQDLSPGQLRAITDETDIKVIDRTQLILDIFAQRAQSRDGKIQVELAQLKYSLPRLHSKNTGMSRLQGGIGGRGPGETKLEINRRRAREQIQRLEEEIEEISKQRQVRRKRRTQNNIPIVSVVGYTNAGKSTLLNGLTQSEVRCEDKLFATLRPTTRKLRYPRERDIIFTDTVGFIHELPPDLVSAFKATLEELYTADLLIHLVDISAENFEQQMSAVNEILRELELDEKEQILVFNKIDKIDEEAARSLAQTYNAIPISAIDMETTMPLIDELDERLLRQTQESDEGKTWTRN
jgi:GTP-binding protein HflX